MSFLCGERVGQDAKPGNVDRDLVARLQPNRCLLAHLNAFRCAGDDDIARLQRGVPTEESDDLGDTENHVTRPRELADLDIDLAQNSESLRVGDFGGRDDIWA